MLLTVEWWWWLMFLVMAMKVHWWWRQVYKVPLKKRGILKVRKQITWNSTPRFNPYIQPGSISGKNTCMATLCFLIFQQEQKQEVLTTLQRTGGKCLVRPVHRSWVDLMERWCKAGPPQNTWAVLNGQKITSCLFLNTLSSAPYAEGDKKGSSETLFLAFTEFEGRCLHDWTIDASGKNWFLRFPERNYRSSQWKMCTEVAAELLSWEVHWI